MPPKTKMYDLDALVEALCSAADELETTGVSESGEAILVRFGVPKAFAIRAGLIALKHEVKYALQHDLPVNVQRLNERLQHLAKYPRPGLPKVRCNGKCQCGKKPVYDEVTHAAPSGKLRRVPA